MRNYLILMFLATFSCGCADQLPGPVVYLQFDTTRNLSPDTAGATPAWTEEEKAWGTLGVRQWEAVGYGPFYRLDQVEIDPSLHELDPSISHYDPNDPQLQDSYIIVTLHKDSDMFLPNGNQYAGLTPTGGREVFINSHLWDGWSYTYFVSTVTHEMGHLLLHSGHLSDDKPGIMNAAPSQSNYHLTANDLAFACQQANRCETYQ